MKQVVTAVGATARLHAELGATMKTIALAVLTALLFGCASTPENDAKWKAFADGLGAGANAYNAGYNSVPQYRPAPVYYQPPAQVQQPVYVPPQVYARQPVYAPPPPPSAIVYPAGFFQSENTNGSMKYCRYSNGAILTVGGHQLCPQSTK